MMRYKQIKELVIVDLLQANRQANNGNKKKAIDKDNLKIRIFLQNVLFLFIYGTFFGTMLLNVPLPEYPGMFTNALNFMALFIVLQMFQLIFNVFYPDTSLSEYLSLPFSMSELFISKLLTILLSTASFFVIPIVMITMLGAQAGHHLLYVIPLAIILSAIIIGAIILIIFVAIHLLHQIPLFIKHKRTMSIVIYVVLFAALFYVIFTRDTSLEYSLEGIIDSDPNALFMGFHEIFIAGSMLTGWIKVGGWALVVALLTIVAFKWIVPDLYSDDKTGAPKSQKKKRKTKERSTQMSQSIWLVFIKYQMRQLFESAFIIQMVFSKLYFPIFFLLPAMINDGGVDISFLSEIPYFGGLYMMAGALFAGLVVSETTVSGIIISFDKENYSYIQSLPMQFRQYMQFKFWFAFAVEWALGTLILGVTAFVINAPLSVALFVLLGNTLGTFIASLYFYMRDFRLLNLTWSNFTELQQRGMNHFMRAILNVLLIFVGVFATGALVFWLILQSNKWIVIGISSFIAIVLIGLVIGIYYYAQKKFWVKFSY